MSNYMPKCATCKHFEFCIVQKHLTEMALILWNINREEEKIANKSIRIDSFSRAEVCDRPQMDCSLCWKESHCKAIEEAEREGK